MISSEAHEARSRGVGHSGPYPLRRLTLAVGLLALVFLCLGETQAQTDVGYVLEVQGQWFLDKSPRRELQRGERLPAGLRIWAKSREPDDYIIVAGLDGKIIARRFCGRSTDCNRPLTLQAKKGTDPGLFSIVLEAAMRLISGAPNRYSVHRVRKGEDELREAVVLIDRGRADLKPIFQAMPRGKYHLRLRGPLPMQVAHSAGEFALDWDPNSAKGIEVGGVDTGLYEMRLIEKTDGAGLPTSQTAWILFVNSEVGEKAAKSFGHALSLTDSWGDDVAPSTKRSVLRAYLEHLAVTNAK